MKKYNVGDTWEKQVKGVVYLMQKQPQGRAKAIKRITPYKNKNTANSKSNIPETKKVVAIKPKNFKNPDNWIYDIKPNKGISVKPFDPKMHRMVKIDNRTYKMVAR